MTRHTRLLDMLICLTLLCVATQIIFFAIHYQVSDLLDTMVSHSIGRQFFHPVIFLPLLGFFLIQLISYVLFVVWIWLIATACGELGQFSRFKIYLFGLLVWLISWIAIFTLNNYFFPHSFFSQLFRHEIIASDKFNNVLALVSCGFLCLTSLLAFIYIFWCKRYRLIASIFLLIGFISVGLHAYDKSLAHFYVKMPANTQPNIILIGLDSLRPDFTNYFGNSTIFTPNINQFLKTAVVFTEAYTPLARTYPAWMSILTAQHPKHSGARNNLVNPTPVLTHAMLAKRLQLAGYETIYATDEKRFSDITKEYGFDKLLGPSMGVNDFILGSLSDFPLTNLLINTAIGRWLFPYNYANRAAAMTYEPHSFLNLVRSGLLQRTHKPLFLAIHLCVSHWPFTWARDNQKENLPDPLRYQSSVEEIDKELGELLKLLKSAGLLENSLIVLLSDHGTGLGLPFDRIIAKQNYQGDVEKLKWLPTFNLSVKNGKGLSIPSLATSYGQGTDVLSTRQYHVLLAFKGVGFAHPVTARSSLLDIAPTVLDYLHLAPLQKTDGISLYPRLKNVSANFHSRALFFESGYSITEIEKNNIDTKQVIEKSLAGYQINPHTALLSIIPSIERLYVQSKQRAILLDDWLMARIPANKEFKLAPGPNHTLVFKAFMIPSYYVLVNVKTLEWTIGFSSPLAKKAPVKELLGRFRGFYGDEIGSKNSVILSAAKDR